MLTNNIYDIIPGYAELEERVEEFQNQFDDGMAEISKGSAQIEDIISLNTQTRNDLDYLKSRLNPAFMAKIEKTFQVIQGLQYDIEVIKMNASQFANRKELE